MKRGWTVCLLFVSVFFISSVFAADIRGEKAYEAAIKAYNAHEYQKAVYAFQNSIKYDPLLYKSYCMLGLSYILNDEPDRGEETFLTAIHEFPMEWKAFVLLAEYYTTQEKYDLALNYYQQALNLSSMSKKEKKMYQAKLDQVIKQRRLTWSVSEATKKEILSTLEVPLDFRQWRPALVEKKGSDFHVVYALKEEDYKGDKWKKSLDVSCSIISAPDSFTQLNEWLAAYYRKLDADLDTIDESSDTRLFETIVRKPQLFIIGRIFPTNTGFCIAQYMQKNRIKDTERDDWIALIKKIQVK